MGSRASGLISSGTNTLGTRICCWIPTERVKILECDPETQTRFQALGQTSGTKREGDEFLAGLVARVGALYIRYPALFAIAEEPEASVEAIFREERWHIPFCRQLGVGETH
jgi:hypothetical protein